MAANDLKGFAKRIRVTTERIVKNTDQLVRKVALLVDTAVVMSTPVDTGRARANWQTGLGAPPQGELPEPASPGEGVSRSLDEAQSVLPGYNGSGDIYIVNNLHYIRKLNEGSSKQAPAGFVETAVVAAVSAIRGVKLVRD